LNDYLASVFTKEDLISIPSFYVPMVVQYLLTDIEFTLQEFHATAAKKTFYTFI